MEQPKRRSWRILARAKGKAVDLRFNVAIERGPLSPSNVRTRFSFLLRIQRLLIAVKLENYELEPKASKKIVMPLFAKVFGCPGRLRWFRGNGGAQKCSEPSKTLITGFSEAAAIPSSLKVLCSKVLQPKRSWMIWPVIFLLLLIFFCELQKVIALNHWVPSLLQHTLLAHKHNSFLSR